MSAVSRGPSQYLYLAAKPDGGRKLGMRRARDSRHLSEQLRRERLVHLRSWTVPGWAGADDKVSLKDQAELHLQLAQLLSRGVPLTEALEVTAKSVAPATRPRVERMRELVSSGSSFSDAAFTTGMFDRVTVAVYKAAERSGDLGGAAKQMSATARRQLAIKGKVGTLIIYPAIVLAISVLVSLFMITIIVPKVGKTLRDTGMDLPWYTEAMISIGDFLRNNALLVALAALVAAAAVVFARRLIMAGVNRAIRVLPLFKQVVLAQESARFFTVMAAMSHSGVTLADALGVASDAIGHPTLKRQLVNLRSRLIEGGVLRMLIDSVEALPLPTRRLLIAAERSGDLDSAFETLANDTAEELDRRASRLLAALEPMLIVGLFLMIGSMVLAIMVPLIKSTAEYAG